MSIEILLITNYIIELSLRFCYIFLLFFVYYSTVKKGKLSGSERNKRWREKKGADFQKAESERVEKIRSRVAQMSATDLQKYKMAAAERKIKSCMLKKQKEMEMGENASPETDNTSLSASTSYQPFKRPQSLDKAIKRSIRALPQSPRKRQAMVSRLAERFAVDIQKKMGSVVVDKCKWPFRGSTEHGLQLLLPI